MAIYIAAQSTWDTEQFANTFIKNIATKFGFPKGIVSDRGSLFTSKLWTEICFHYQIERRLSTAYHPQTDGQTERQNQTLETFLRCFANKNQDNWLKLLLFAEFAYNNTPHSSTGDLVLLSSKNLKLSQPSRKMSAKFIGPFAVKEPVGRQAYRLRLLVSYRIHDVFHVSLLKPFEKRDGEPLTNIAVPEIAPDGEELWEVERILDKRVRKGKREYLLR
ncbi:gag/polymerase/env polyprotein [Teratosphaeria destructans]|uniref:Gag/polymerase/env polyprotein n=1 Tax=Teratosphaeria destructans TaxID=418781 RepID=A0A9W7T123_9PEZI|nr:gag/polymerase/env polyprotein [Teratosphaeria destructans]